MREYVASSSSACALNAWDRNGKLRAFFVVELGAKNFSTYVLAAIQKSIMCLTPLISSSSK